MTRHFGTLINVLAIIIGAAYAAAMLVYALSL